MKVVPSEHEEQAALFEWAEMARCKHPCLKLLYAIPNGGKRDKITAARLKSEGVKKGVPDTCLPVPKGEYHGLYIELKRLKDSKTSPEQKQWQKDLTEQGYKAIICKGWQSAAKEIMNYLKEVE